MTAPADPARAAPMAAALDRFAASLGIDTTTVGADIAPRWDALHAAGVARPGLAFAGWLDLALVGGVVPPLLANSADVGSALRILARFHPLWGTDEVVAAPQRDGGLIVRLRSPDGAPPHPDTFAAFAALLGRFLAQLTTPPVRPMRLVRRAAHPGGLEAVADELMCDASDDRIEFGAEALSVRLTHADPTVAAVLLGYAEAGTTTRDRAWAERVRAEVRRAPGAPPDLATVARRLAVSSRTLQQRLHGEDTSFASIVDDERRTFALALLRRADVSVSDAAVRVGFDSVEGFARAVRRWTGSSPTAWRANGG